MEIDFYKKKNTLICLHNSAGLDGMMFLMNIPTTCSSFDMLTCVARGGGKGGGGGFKDHWRVYKYMFDNESNTEMCICSFLEYLSADNAHAERCGRLSDQRDVDLFAPANVCKENLH